MSLIISLPESFSDSEDYWIPLSDGNRLAVRIWLPDKAVQMPVPAILEYIPYRKRDFYRATDEALHPYFAGHGYACLRVDMRGSGDSSGLLTDEYLAQEQDDCLEILQWIAAQPWCDGRVGMMGISWGGFNSLQVAARRPPALKAIITLCSTDDRYCDDVHYMGGCLLLDNLIWASQMFIRSSRSPDPALVGERWKEMWLARLRDTVPFIQPWLSHQHRDAYWRHGSVCEDYEAIVCPVYAIGGWSDAYVNSIPRLLQNLKVPRKGLVGPWAHELPHRAHPGPQIDFLQECVRWWDRWLKGIENGVMDGPMYRVWMQDYAAPRSFHSERAGRWIGENVWPSPDIHPRRYLLDRCGLLTSSPASESNLTLSSPQTTGLNYRRWCPWGEGSEMATDQREDDGKSLTFDTGILDQAIEILGQPGVTVELSSDSPLALIAARLSDVAPNGAVTLISYGLLNLAHRDSHEKPEPLIPGRRYSVRLVMNHIAHRFRKGHRVRLALSNSYWPIAWPSPSTVALTIHCGTSALDLPARQPRPEDDAIAPLGESVVLPAMKHTMTRAVPYHRKVEHDLGEGSVLVTATKDTYEWHIDDINLDCSTETVEKYSINQSDPLSAHVSVGSTHGLSRGSWQARSKARSSMRSTATEFVLALDLEAFENDERIFSKHWDFRFSRDLV
jgi:uncharacterized protein